MNDLPEFNGFWWVPSNPDRQLAGRLFSDSDAAKLVLTIDSPSPSGALFSISETRDYEVLHGRTTEGKSITLLKCFDLNTSWSASGIEKRIILANYVLIGGLVPEDTLQHAFRKLSLKWPSLKYWFFKSGIQVEHNKENFRSFKISYEPHEEIRFSYSENSEIVFAFSTDTIPMGGPLSEGIDFREIVWVELTKEQPGSLDYFLERLNELVHFFSICVLEYNHPEKITLVGDFDIEKRDDGIEIEPYLDVYFSTIHKPQADRLPHPMEVLLTHASIQNIFPDLLRSWAAVADKLSPSRSLYFSALYGQNRYIESTFLSLAQAAEVIHRRLYGGTYIEPSRYEDEVKPFLNNAIPCDLPPDVRTAYSQRLQFFNEYSLAKRLKHLSKNHEDVLNKYVPNWKTKIRDIVDARNYYTHYSESEETSKPDINGLVDNREYLRMLIELEMLSAAGLDKSLLHKRAIECQRYIWRFPKNRKK